MGIEEKIRIVRQCLEGEIGISEASREAGVDRAAVRQWIARYEAEGADAFLPHERNRNYSQELKKQAVREYLAGGIKTLYFFCSLDGVRFKTAGGLLLGLVLEKYVMLIFR